MKKINIVLLITILSLVFTSCNKTTLNYEQHFYSVFEITSTSENAFTSTGTAFKCTKGRVLTNAHVVSFNRLNEVFHHENIVGALYNSHKSITFEIYRIDYDKDLAILEPIDNFELFNSISGLSFYARNYEVIGNSIFTIGNLHDIGLALNRGYISSRNKIFVHNGIENVFMQTSIAISGGSSGGLVFNNQHRVIGIMTFRLRDANGHLVDGASFSIPISVINDFAN